MTAEKLHDAIGLLPGDLVAATDRLRTVPRRKVFYWKPILATAACLVLLLSTGLVLQRKILPVTEMKTESAVAAPMAPQITMDSAVEEAPAAEAAPMAPAEDAAGTMEESAAENSLCIDHSHRFAEAEKEAEEVPSGYSGHLVTKLWLDGREYTLHGADSAAMTDILTELAYDPDAVCRCMAEFHVDTELLTGIEVNLSEAFARCEQGQAPLTEAQVRILRDILEGLQ